MMSLQFDDTADMVWFIGQVIMLVFLFIYFIMMLESYRKAGTESQKRMAFGFTIFAFTITLAQGLYLWEIVYSRMGMSSPFPRLIKIGGTGYVYIMLIIFAVGYLFLMDPIEEFIIRSERKWITLLNKISVVMLGIPYLGALIYNAPPMDEYWTYIAFPGVVIFGIASLFSIFGSFFFYLRLGVQGSGVVRKKGLLIGIGILLMYIAFLGGSQIKTTFGGWWGTVFGPILMIIGAIMLLVGHKIEI